MAKANLDLPCSPEVADLVVRQAAKIERLQVTLVRALSVLEAAAAHKSCSMAAGVLVSEIKSLLAHEQQAPKPEPKRGPEYGCDSAGWPDVVGDRDRS